jgi:hypothetical protein
VLTRDADGSPVLLFTGWDASMKKGLSSVRAMARRLSAASSGPSPSKAHEHLLGARPNKQARRPGFGYTESCDGPLATAVEPAV